MSYLSNYLNLIQDKSEKAIRYKAGWLSLSIMERVRGLMIVLSMVVFCALGVVFSLFALILVIYFYQPLISLHPTGYWLMSAFFLLLFIYCIYFIRRLLSEEEWIKHYESDELLNEATLKLQEMKVNE